MQPVSKHLGLETRHSVPTEQMARDTVAYLQRIGDPMWQSALAPIIRACIEDNPEPFYQMLGCPTTATEALGGAKNDWSSPPPTKRLHRAKRVSTMAQIFTRPVRNMRGATAERYRQSAEYLQTLQASPLRRDVSAVAQSAAVATHDLEAELLRSPVEAAAVARDMPTQTLCSVGFALHGPISKRLHAQTRCIARRAAAGSPTCTSAVPTPRQGQIFESPRSACPEATRGAQCVSCNDQATHQSQVHIAWRWPPTRAPCNVDPPHFQLCQRRVSTLADNTRMANYEALTTLDNPVHGCSVTSFAMTDDQKRKLLKAHYATTKEIFAAWRACGYPHPPPPRPEFPEILRGLICGARTRAGTACKQTALLTGGRCKLHGGCSTGPTSPQGKKTSSQNGTVPKTKRTP